MFKSISFLRSFDVKKIRLHLYTPLYRNGYALLFSAAMTSVLGFMYWILAARYYTAEAVGLSSAAISAMMFISGVSQLNLKGALIRFLPRSGHRTFRFVFMSYLISAILTLFSSSVFVIIFRTYSKGDDLLVSNPLMLAIFVVSSVAWSIFTLQDHVLTGLRKTMWIPLENSIFSIVKLILLYIFAGYVQSYGIFASYTVPVIISLVPVNYFIFRRFISSHARETEKIMIPVKAKQIAKYIAGDYVGSIFGLMSTSLLPVMVTYQLGASANAYFYLPWVITNSLLLISSNMTTSLTVEGSLDETKLAIYGKRTFKHILRLLIPAVAVFVFGASLLLHIFGSNYSSEGAVLLRLLALSTLPNSISALYIGLARVKNQVKGIASVQGVLCALILGLSYILMPWYGITGIGWAWLISQTVVAIWLSFTWLRPVLWNTAVQ